LVCFDDSEIEGIVVVFMRFDDGEVEGIVVVFMYDSWSIRLIVSFLCAFRFDASGVA
jgi:hypothetical protein